MRAAQPRPGRSSSATRTARCASTSVEKKQRKRNPVAAVHDLDPAAGSRAQAGLRRAAHHAHRAAPVRRRRFRRRPRRPDHLHAHRLGEPGRGGHPRDPRRDRAPLRRGRVADVAAPVQDQVEERAGSPRSRAPDLGGAHAGAARRQDRGRRAQALHADLAARRRLPDGSGRVRHRGGRPVPPAPATCSAPMARRWCRLASSPCTARASTMSR